MNFFADTFSELQDWKQLCTAFADQEVPVCVTGLSAVHKAQLALTLAGHSEKPILLLTGSEADAIKLCADINAMSGQTIALHYPSKELLFTAAESKSAE